MNALTYFPWAVPRTSSISLVNIPGRFLSPNIARLYR